MAKSRAAIVREESSLMDEATTPRAVRTASPSSPMAAKLQAAAEPAGAGTGT